MNAETKTDQSTSPTALLTKSRRNLLIVGTLAWTIGVLDIRVEEISLFGFKANGKEEAFASLLTIVLLYYLILYAIRLWMYRYQRLIEHEQEKIDSSVWKQPGNRQLYQQVVAIVDLASLTPGVWTRPWGIFRRENYCLVRKGKVAKANDEALEGTQSNDLTPSRNLTPDESVGKRILKRQALMLAWADLFVHQLPWAYSAIPLYWLIPMVFNLIFAKPAVTAGLWHVC